MARRGAAPSRSMNMPARRRTLGSRLAWYVAFLSFRLVFFVCLKVDPQGRPVAAQHAWLIMHDRLQLPLAGLQFMFLAQGYFSIYFPPQRAADAKSEFEGDGIRCSMWSASTKSAPNLAQDNFLDLEVLALSNRF